MLQDKFSLLMGEVIHGLNKQVEETVSEAYDLGFKNGSQSVKRYAVNVLKFEEDLVKDIFKQFTTLEDAQAYVRRVKEKNYAAYLYEYDYVNDQYGALDESMEV